jgi:hypothetical protein
MSKVRIQINSLLNKIKMGMSIICSVNRPVYDCSILHLHTRSNVIFACHIIIYIIILFSLPSPQHWSFVYFVNTIIIIIVHNGDRYYDALLVYVREFFGCPRVETFLRPGVTGFPLYTYTHTHTHTHNITLYVSILVRKESFHLGHYTLFRKS